MEQQTMIIITVVLVAVVAVLTVGIVGGMYLMGETYKVPIAAKSLESNIRIESNHLKLKEVSEKPAPGILTDNETIVGKITSRSIKSGSTFKSSDLRTTFKILKASRSIEKGARLRRNMFRTAKSEADQISSETVFDFSSVKNKFTKSSIEKGTVLRSTHVYESQQQYVVATKKISTNSVIRQHQVKVIKKPTKPNNAVSEQKSVVGRAVRTEINPGDPIRSTDLFPDKDQLSYFIPLYKRAVSIPISSYNNVSYLLRPGDLVDVYVYLPQGFQRGNAFGVNDQLSSNVLQKVADGAEIISLDGVFDPSKIGQKKKGKKSKKKSKVSYKTATIAVPLREAEKLTLIRGMQESGAGDLRFFLLLRAQQLDSEYGRRRVSNYDLFNPELGDVMNRRTDGPQVQVIQGDESQVYRVPEYK